MLREILYDNNTAMPLYRHAMDALANRHRATASNIANASTPDYRPRRVEFEDQLRVALDRRKRMVHTDSRHLPAVDEYNDVRHTAYREEEALSRENGFDMEREAGILATNQIHYGLVIKRAGGLFNAVRELSKLK